MFVAVDDVLTLTSVDNPNLDITKQLISLAKDGKNSGKITLLAVMPTAINAIEKLADVRLKIEDNDKLLKL